MCKHSFHFCAYCLGIFLFKINGTPRQKQKVQQTSIDFDIFTTPQYRVSCLLSTRKLWADVFKSRYIFVGSARIMHISYYTVFGCTNICIFINCYTNNMVWETTEITQLFKILISDFCINLHKWALMIDRKYVPIFVYLPVSGHLSSSDGTVLGPKFDFIINCRCQNRKLLEVI